MGAAQQRGGLMTKVIDKIEKRFVIPCGAMDVKATGICRRQLKDRFDSLLDRLTEEIHPDYVKPEHPDFGENGVQAEQQKSLFNKALKDEEEETTTAPSKSTKDVLQGNSKLLQNPTGKLEKR
jgi:hypothetical protein